VARLKPGQISPLSRLSQLARPTAYRCRNVLRAACITVLFSCIVSAKQLAQTLSVATTDEGKSHKHIFERAIYIRLYYPLFYNFLPSFVIILSIFNTSRRLSPCPRLLNSIDDYLIIIPTGPYSTWRHLRLTVFPSRSLMLFPILLGTNTPTTESLWRRQPSNTLHFFLQFPHFL